MSIDQILNALLVLGIELVGWLRELGYRMGIITVKDAKWLLCDRVRMVWRRTVRRSVRAIFLAAQHFLLSSRLVGRPQFGLILFDFIQIRNETLLLLHFGKLLVAVAFL